MELERPLFRDMNIHLGSGSTPSFTQHRTSKHPATIRKPPFQIQVSGLTDIGGAVENQDEYFILQMPEALVIGVLDGHGRDFGRIAAAAAKARLVRYFSENEQNLLVDPYLCMVQAFCEAHETIRNALHQELTSSGWEVAENEGYLVRRKHPSQHWLCVQGGASCSVIAIVGTSMIIANVGDSAGIICAPRTMNEGFIRLIGDSGFDEQLVQQGGMTGVFQDGVTEMQIQETDPELEVPDDRISTTSTILNWGPAGGEPIRSAESLNQKNVLVVTGDHSPENPIEFERLRRFWPSDDPLHPRLLVVYDSQTQEKDRCEPVFRLDETGKPSVTGHGRYYKNVRREWASLVCTPPSAKFQDALAFTRSVGDLHLHAYGVSQLPEVRYMDLAPLALATDPLQESPSTSVISILLASDGVWDNWKYDNVGAFLLDQTCTSAVTQGPQGAKLVLESFMSRNATYAHRNFGGQADNASAILVYLIPSCESELS